MEWLASVSVVMGTSGTLDDRTMAALKIGVSGRVTEKGGRVSECLGLDEWS